MVSIMKMDEQELCIKMAKMEVKVDEIGKNVNEMKSDVKQLAKSVDERVDFLEKTVDKKADKVEVHDMIWCVLKKVGASMAIVSLILGLISAIIKFFPR